MDLSIEFIGVFGLPPVQHVELAAALGCRYISVALQPIDYNPQAYPKYSLKEDKLLRHEVIAAMRHCGVGISLGEGFAIFPDTDVRSTYIADLEVMHELGAERINVVSFDPDLRRTFDQLAMLAEMAAEAGLITMLEFVPIFTIPDLPTATAAIRHVGRKDCLLLIDTMHFCRSGASVNDLASLDPAMIRYVQLCDVPLVPSNLDYMSEAMFERLPPGEGELPLREILAALPRDRVIGLEVPMRFDAEQGLNPRARMARCVDAANRLLAQTAGTFR